MKRDVLLIAAAGFASAIERVRERYDPLAGKVPPHVTLIFPEPAPALPRELLERAGDPGLSSLASILFTAVTAAADATIWLTPDADGAERLMAWRERLFVSLQRPVSAARPYWPHLTLGHVRGGDEAPVLDELREQLRLPIRLDFSHLLLEEFGDDEVSREVARLAVR